MFFIDTTVEPRNKTYCEIFDAIDAKVAQYGKILLYNHLYSFNSKVNHEVFDDLMNYKEILKMKLDCDECLCTYTTDEIISKIRKLTNSIC